MCLIHLLPPCQAEEPARSRYLVTGELQGPQASYTTPIDSLPPVCHNGIGLTSLSNEITKEVKTL